ncbi:MAG: hypothetical protein DWQ01_19100 [Planctomycetota bacterium]|nr:MAG: hypothetical protein DWQ01_19100 [Planctomycetota bacterium]
MNSIEGFPCHRYGAVGGEQNGQRQAQQETGKPGSATGRGPDDQISYAHEGGTKAAVETEVRTGIKRARQPNGGPNGVTVSAAVFQFQQRQNQKWQPLAMAIADVGQH